MVQNDMSCEVLRTDADVQCDTFSRSHDAVFELSMRFAEPFSLKPGLSAEGKLEAERLMFNELTQSTLMSHPSLLGSLTLHYSLPLGQFDGFVSPHQHD